MKSLRSSLGLLMQFTNEQRDYGVAELAERTGLSKGQVSKSLDVFADFGLLRQDPETRRYSVGLRAHVLGARYVMHNELCRTGYPVMRDLVERSGHSVRLSVLDGDRSLYLLGLEGPLFFDTGLRAGTWLPAQSTTAGRVQLAFIDPKESARIISTHPLRAVTEFTITEKAKIRKIIQDTRKYGYTAQRNEITLGLGTISVPLFGPRQQLLGSLGLAFPSHVVAPKDDARLANELHESARVLSQRMGCEAYPFGLAAAPAAGPNR